MVCSFIYLMIDMYPDTFSFVRKWKSQPEVFITNEQIKKAVHVALFNQMFVNMPFALVSYYLFKQRGLQLDPASFPAVSTVLRDFLVFMVFEEIGFYYGHRAGHSSVLYARIHKVCISSVCVAQQFGNQPNNRNTMSSPPRSVARRYTLIPSSISL